MDAPTAVSMLVKLCKSAKRGDNSIFYLVSVGTGEILAASTNAELVANEAVYNGQTAKKLMLGKLKADGLTIQPVEELATIEPKEANDD